MVAGVWWWIAFPVVAHRHAVHRPVPARRVDERVHRSAQPPARGWEAAHDATPRSDAPRRCRADAVLRVDGPAGLLPTRLLRREPRGAGGRRHHASTSTPTRSTASPANRARGKTTLIKTIAARHPAAARGGGRHGRRSTSSTGGIEHPSAPSRASCARIRWQHLSYIMQGSMNVLNPVRRVRHSFDDFASRHIGRPRPAFLGTRRDAPRSALHLDARRARRLSARALRRHAPARRPSRSPPSAGRTSSSPTSRRRRSTSSCRRTCSA